MAGKGNGKLVAEIMRRLSFEDLEALKTEWGNTELNIIGFTDSILRLLDLSSAERVAFTKGLVDVFRSVAANKKTSKVTFADCNQYFVMKNSEVEAGIYEKELPLYIREEARQYAQPPVVYGKKQADNARLREPLNYRQGQGHNNRLLQDFAVARNNELVFCQYDNAEEIVMYDSNYKKISELKPKGKASADGARLHVKDLQPIVSFKWSDRQQVVAVYASNLLTFWARKENFRYGLSLACEDEMMHVDYLQYCNLWLTVRTRDGAILYWDAAAPKSIETFQHEFLTEDLANNKRVQYAEIRFASLFCVAAKTRLHFVSHPKKQLTATLELVEPVRSISYSDRYQLMFVGCFQMEVHIYELDPIHCDFSRKESRIKCSHIVVCVRKRPNSSTLVTYDESNSLKLWNVVDMVCYQTVRTDTYTPLQAIICLHDKLVVGVYRLGDYEFTATASQEKKMVEALTLFEDTLYLAVNGTIRCVSLCTGKTTQILETNEEVEYLDYNPTHDCLAVVSNRQVLREVSVQGEELCKHAMGKQPIHVSYNRPANHYYLMVPGGRQLQVGFFSDVFVPVWSISRLRCEMLDFNYYLGLLAVLDGGVLSLLELESSSFRMTHQLLLGGNEPLQIRFIVGTWCLLCVYRTELMVLQLGADGTLTRKYKMPLSLEEDQTINCFSCSETVDVKSKLVRFLTLFIGTTHGRLLRVFVKNCNFPLQDSKGTLSVFSREDVHRKTISISFDILHFNFRHAQVDVVAVSYSYLISESTAKQTKMRNIRFLELKPETAISRLVVLCNVNMVLVYNDKCELVGEINVSCTYPILWSVEEASEASDRQELYAKKLLSFIANEVLEEQAGRKSPLPPPSKSFAVRSEIEDKNMGPEPTRFRRMLPIEEVISINNSFRRQTPETVRASSYRKPLAYTKSREEFKQGLMRQPSSNSVSQRVRTEQAESHTSRDRASSRLQTEHIQPSPLLLSPLKKTIATSTNLDIDWMKELKGCTTRLKRSRVKRQDVQQEVHFPREFALPMLQSTSSSRRK